MASHGVIFAPDGAPRSAWTRHLDAPCPFVMDLEPGATVAHLDEQLTPDELATMTKALVTSPTLDERHVRERLAVPTDVQASAGERLAYRPAARLVVSRDSDGRETPKHDFTRSPR